MCFHASVFASEVLCFHCVHLCVGVFLQFRHRHSFGLKVELIRVCMVTIQNIWGLIMPKFHTSPRIITILVFFIWLRLKHLRWVPKCVYAEKKQNQNPDCKMMFLQNASFWSRLLACSNCFFNKTQVTWNLFFCASVQGGNGEPGKEQEV